MRSRVKEDVARPIGRFVPAALVVTRRFLVYTHMNEALGQLGARLCAGTWRARAVCHRAARLLVSLLSRGRRPAHHRLCDPPQRTDDLLRVSRNTGIDCWLLSALL